MIRKFFTILFNVLGFITFTAIVCGATFWAVGYYKNAHAADKEQATLVPITSLPQLSAPADTPTATAAQFATPIRPPKTISNNPARTKRAPAPVTHSTSANKAEKKAPAIAAVETPKNPPLMGRPGGATPKTNTQRPKPNRQRTITKAQAPAMPQTLTWHASDSGNPRTGRGSIVNVNNTTDLERQVIKEAEMWRQLKQAADQIRNPPVWESGVVKLLTGKDK